MTKTNNDEIAKFQAENAKMIETYSGNKDWQDISASWTNHSFQNRYMYNFAWLGRPIIQFPTDIMAVQEVVWDVKPDLIIETGIAHGGSLILSASLLAMLDMAEAVESGKTIDPKKSKRHVLGVDIDIREHNRAAIEAHPMSNWISMIQGPSLDKSVVSQVHEFAKDYERILVCLDSNHTHDHVMGELEAYAPLASKGSYCMVFDTIVEDLPEDAFPDRPWAPGDNPKTAVREYLKILENEGRKGVDGTPLQLERNAQLEDKLMLSVAPEGYLQRK